MDYHFREMAAADGVAIIGILNYYAENGFEAYFEKRLPDSAFSLLMQQRGNFPALSVLNELGEVIGFGWLKAYKSISGFRYTAEVSYFLVPEVTGKGIGAQILDFLEREAGKMGITSIIASVSSLNEGSIAFHKKHGFEERGRLLRVLCKKDRIFDEVILQKQI
ncbi:MAG: GNAT family N-acetyltransferase [Candidatus Cloacimonetes bacterium]|nr:GNAT family N-acetyltransferase [Candidatus Cloacimonadota bacterium]